MSSDTSTEPGNSTKPGSSRLNPAGEGVLLAEERLLKAPGSRLSRVLMSFEIIVEGTSKPISPRQLRTQNFEGVTVVGAVGTLEGKAGVFAQACWFGGGDLDWMWVLLDEIRSIRVQRDERFRRGEPCVWLCTMHGDYAMTLPKREYIDHWEETLHMMGTDAADAAIEMWPRSGMRPHWWDKRWENFWPFDKTPPVSTPNQPFSEMVLEDPAPGASCEGDTQPSTTEWARVLPDGGHMSTELGYVPPSLYHLRSPWVLRQDGGMLLPQDSVHRGEKRKAE